MLINKLFTVWIIIFISSLISDNEENVETEIVGSDIIAHSKLFGVPWNNGRSSTKNDGFSPNPKDRRCSSNSNNGGFSTNSNNSEFFLGGDKECGSPHDMLVLSEHNPSGKVKGEQLREGDILIPSSSKNVRRNENQPPLWDNGQIYIEMNGVNKKLRNIILQAIKEWEDSSCLKFIQGCTKGNACVRVTAQTKYCSSVIGKAPKYQELQLASNCHSLKIVRHELGHVIGFYHEQSRFDRDNYIHIIKENLLPNTDTEFTKFMGNWGAEYDYTSVMQYDGKSFSNDRVNKNTMVTHNPHYQTIMGNSKTLSFRDKFRVNRMYSCSAQCSNKHIQCKHGGYLSPYKGNNQPCRCMCPPRISGTLCEHKPHPYEYYDVPACSRNITQSTTIQTPGYPRRNNPPEKCSYWIQAPRGRRIQVQFEDFSFAPSISDGTGPDKCYFERVEVRTQNLYNGEMFCGEDLKGRTLTSASENFIMIIDVEENVHSKRGLKANVNFV